MSEAIFMHQQAVKLMLYTIQRIFWTTLDTGITMLHPATEPVTASEVYEYLTGKKFVNELEGVPADYAYRTVHGALFNGKDGYIYSKNTVLEEIEEFIE